MESYENSNGMACFIGILEEFYQEAEPHGNWKGSFVSLIEFLCFFCAPSKRSILQFPKGLFGRMNFITYEQEKNHVTTREQTLERCPNLALASAFFSPGTKGSFSPGW